MHAQLKRRMVTPNHKSAFSDKITMNRADKRGNMKYPAVLEKYRIIVRTWTWFESVRKAIERQATWSMATQDRSFQSLVRDKRGTKDGYTQSYTSQG